MIINMELREIMKKILINTVEEFQIWCSTLGSVIALDFECSSLNYLEMEFDGFSLCDGDRAMYTRNPDLLFYLSLYFSEGLWVFHNASFDLKCCRKFCEEEPKNIFCTLVGTKLVNENLNSHSLKYLAELVLKVDPKLIKKYDEVGGDVNSAEFIDYAQNDAIWTYQLYEVLSHRLKKENLEYIAGIEMEFQRVLAEMEINGALIDIGKLREFQKEVPAILESLRIEMCDLLDIKHGYNTNLFGERELWTATNFSSPDEMIKIAESLGFEIFEKTNPSKRFPKGQKSFAKEAKERLRNQHPFFSLVYRHGKLNHLNNNFVQSLEKFIDKDGRVRTSHNMVRTGRLSCSKPALHQLPNPKKEKLEFNHREVFIPKPGYVLVKADYSGQELKVLGEVSDDKNMRDLFSNGADLHLATANHIFSLGLSSDELLVSNEDYEEVVQKYKQKRHQAKNGVNFPIIYGATAGRIAKDNKVSKEEAERWLDGFFELYPGVKKSIDLIPKELVSFGFVRTLFGRKRRFPLYANAKPNYKRSMQRQAFNMKIQGSSADIGKIAGIKLLKELPKEAKIILFVHDEWVVECPKEIAGKVAVIMKDCMENAVSLSVKLTVDIKIVDNFGE